VGVQIVDHQPDALGLGELRIGEPADHVSEVLFAMMVGDDDVPPTTRWTEEHEEAFHSTPLVLIVVPSDSAGTWWEWSNDVPEELVGTLVQADDWSKGIIRLSIEIEDILHPPQKVRSDLTQAPLSLLPGLEPVFF